MNFETKLKELSPQDMWADYCGFLDMSQEEYMTVQNRLLLEQIDLLGKCELGQRLFNGNVPKTVEEFRKNVPLTSFEDYTDILLTKQEDKLPAKPAIWLKTTWEGGTAPAKLAPYSDEMLKTYKQNILAAMLLSTSRSKGHFNIEKNARVLYGLAPLPYATGLFPKLINEEFSLHFMPSLREAKKLSFTKQSTEGFKQAMSGGIDLFFGMSSIIYGISKNFSSLTQGKRTSTKTALKMTPAMAVKLVTAMYKCKRDNRPMLPKDLFSLLGFVCVGTDSKLFKDALEHYWGVRPLEIAGGTEPSCMGTETWSKDGLVFFPDACFYEFIPEEDMLKSLEDKTFVPRTYLMNQLTANECYELVITVLKGGAFARYRIGDVYRCIRTHNTADGIDLPQFEYLDRIPTVIDIMGFTRITQKEIDHVIKMSRIAVNDWFALKEYDENNYSFLHMYVELSPDEIDKSATGVKLLEEQLAACFKYYDTDFKDLKRLLGLEPFKLTVIPSGTIEKYNKTALNPMRKINPKLRDVNDLMRMIGR